MNREEQIGAIMQEFTDEEIPVLYGYLRVRMGWGGSGILLRADGTIGILDMTFELERYDEELQQRIRHAADRLEPLIRD
jgi:phosphomannomutase